MSTLINCNLPSNDEDFGFVCRNPDVKEFVEKLWSDYEPFADKDFTKHIPIEFHSRFWEMYLTCTLKKLGKAIMPKKRIKGPDIGIENIHSHIWVEAVAAKPGEGVNKISPLAPEQMVFRVPEEQIVLRYTSVIDTKFRAYSRYIEKQIIADSDPYVIAVNGNKVHFSYDDIDEIPYIVQAVLPFGLQIVDMDWDNPNNSEIRYAYRSEIPNKSGCTVQTNIFQKEEYNGISGIVFSRTGVNQLHETLGSDFVFIHNPLARNKLPFGWLGTGYEYRVEGDAPVKVKVMKIPKI